MAYARSLRQNRADPVAEVALRLVTRVRPVGMVFARVSRLMARGAGCALGPSRPAQEEPGLAEGRVVLVAVRGGCRWCPQYGVGPRCKTADNPLQVRDWLPSRAASRTASCSSRA
jgi:hypothetical protein